MRKNIFLLLFLIISVLQNFSKIHAQGGFEVQKEAYEKSSDVNMAMGIPNINFPIMNLPTLSSKLNINISLNYLVNNISSHNIISEVGAGWDILNGFTVSRVTNMYLDDYNVKKTGDSTTCESNVFQYSIPGGSGRFTVNYDKVNHKVVATPFKLSKEKIILEKNTDTLVYKIKSFSVIDENGLKYIFDTPDISYYSRGSIGNSQAQYHNNFYISKILDEKNNTLVNYDYDTTTKTITSGSTSKVILRNKLIKITIQNIGTIDFVYIKSPNYPTNRDNYTLQKIVLKDTGNKITEQSAFEYSDNLTALVTQDKYGNDIKRYSFEYNESIGNGSRDLYGFVNTDNYCNFDEGYLYTKKSIYPPLTSTGALSKVYLPTGGRIEYVYESNTYPGGSDYKLEKITEIPYDTNNTTLYPFTAPANTYQKIFFANELEIESLKAPVNPTPFNFYVKTAGGQSPLTFYDYTVANSLTNCGIKYIASSGGNYDLHVTGTDKQGIMKIYGLRAAPEPVSYAKGLRIRSIKKFESNSATPAESLSYSYASFTNPGIPSSTRYSLSDGSVLIGEDEYDMGEKIVYTNVKVSDSVKNYSTRYTFTDPDNVEQLFGIPVNMVGNVDYNNELKVGTPLLVEQYNGNNQRVFTQQLIYDFETKVQNNYASAIKTPWLKNHSIISKNYMENNIILADTTLLTYESDYGNLKSEKKTDANGEIVEKKYQYASELNNQKLLNANFVGIPLIQETFNTKNGITKTLSKTELKFDNPAHSWASSSVVYDVITGDPETVMTIDKYDGFGNVLQTTSKSGIPTTLVYGYNNTQVIARIEGVAYDELQNLNSVSPIVNASNNDAADATKEGELLTALDSFRKNQALKNYYITTYTYDPLIGITSETSSLGIRKKYVYDNANRLIKTTDVNGVTLEEYKNNIKQH